MHNKIDFEQLGEKIRLIHIDKSTDNYEKLDQFITT